MRFANLNLLNLTLLLLGFFGWGQWILGLQALETPVVPEVTAGQIRNLQGEREFEDRFVMVDVRSKEEMDVSMMPGAITKAEFEENSTLHQGKSVIVYCTIGVRSGNYASTLNRKGWKAWNYKGSILDWCKNSLPLTIDGEKTNRVHTYNRRYSAPENYIAVR